MRQPVLLRLRVKIHSRYSSGFTRLDGVPARSNSRYPRPNPKRILCRLVERDDGAKRVAAMNKEPIVFLAFLALWAGAGLLHADDRFLWRSWGVRDGFTETYSFAVSMTPRGQRLHPPRRRTHHERCSMATALPAYRNLAATRNPTGHPPRGCMPRQGARPVDHFLRRAQRISGRKVDGAVYAAGRSPGPGGSARWASRDGAHGRPPAGVRPGARELARNPHGGKFQNCPFPDNVSRLRRRIVRHRRARAGEVAYFARRRCFRVARRSTATRIA